MKNKLLSNELVVTAITLGVILRLFLPYFRKLLIQGQLMAFFKGALIGDLNKFNTAYLKQAVLVIAITLLTGTGIFTNIEVSDYTIAGFGVGILGELLALLSAFIYGYLGQSLPAAVKKWKGAILNSKLIRDGFMPEGLDPQIAEALKLQPKT